MFRYYKTSALMWFRIWGYGLCFRDKASPLFSSRFSERIGRTKYLDIFGYRITKLIP